MKISIGCDHGAYDLKETLKNHLTAKGYEVADEGTYSKDSCDYPVFAHKVANKVAAGDVDFGILCCTTGIGMSIAANKIPGIRAANCWNSEIAKLSKSHNNANVLCLAARFLEFNEIVGIIESFINTPFSREERHLKRLNLL